MNNSDSNTPKPTTKMVVTFDSEPPRNSGAEKQPEVTIKILKSTASKDDSSEEEEETETETSARQIVHDLAHSKEGEPSILSMMSALQQNQEEQEERRKEERRRKAFKDPAYLAKWGPVEFASVPHPESPYEEEQRRRQAELLVKGPAFVQEINKIAANWNFSISRPRTSTMDSDNKEAIQYRIAIRKADNNLRSLPQPAKDDDQQDSGTEQKLDDSKQEPMDQADPEADKTQDLFTPSYNWVPKPRHEARLDYQRYPYRNRYNSYPGRYPYRNFYEDNTKRPDYVGLRVSDTRNFCPLNGIKDYITAISLILTSKLEYKETQDLIKSRIKELFEKHNLHVPMTRDEKQENYSIENTIPYRTVCKAWITLCDTIGELYHSEISSQQYPTDDQRFSRLVSALEFVGSIILKPDTIRQCQKCICDDDNDLFIKTVHVSSFTEKILDRLIFVEASTDIRFAFHKDRERYRISDIC